MEDPNKPLTQEEIKTYVSMEMSDCFYGLCKNIANEKEPAALNSVYTGLVDAFASCMLSIYNQVGVKEKIPVTKYVGNISSDVITTTLEQLAKTTLKEAAESTSQESPKT